MTRRSFTLPFTSIRMSREMLVNVLGALLLGTAACLACATEVAGVQIDDTQELARQKLVLNGAGVRYKAVFKVYTAALYLPQNAATTEDALKMKGPKRVRIVLLRDTSGETFADEAGNCPPGRLLRGAKWVRVDTIAPPTGDPPNRNTGVFASSNTTTSTPRSGPSTPMYEHNNGKSTPDHALKFAGLGERAEIQIGGKLFGC